MIDDFETEAQCPHCGEYCDCDKGEPHPESCDCESCVRDRLEADDMARTPPRYYTVRVYLCDRQYGGPEEGGWYYTTGQFEKDFGYLTRSFQDEQEAWDYAQQIGMDVLAPINEQRPSMTSVLSQGRYMAKVYDEEAPLSFPAKKPHYE